MADLTERYEELSQNNIDRKNQHGRGHHGLRGRASHALGSSMRAESVVASDGSGDETKKDGFNQTSSNVVERQRLVSGVPVLGSVQTQPGDRIKISSKQAHQVPNDGQE